MRALLRFYGGLTRFFGARRRFVRRLAGLALVVLGVHVAADRIDDAMFRLLDALDLWVDSAVWSFLEWLSGLGAFSGPEAAAHAQRFAEWLDLGEKDTAAKVLALALELFVDAILLDFAWGKRDVEEAEARVRFVDEIKESARELGDALWPLDLERLSVPLVLFGLSTAGALSLSMALESFVAGTLTDVIPLWRWSTNVAASAGLLGAALVIWRFVPDLVHGGVMRAHERGERALARLESARQTTSAHPRLAVLGAQLQRVRRGAFLAAVVLPIAWISLTTQEPFFGLVARVGAHL